MSHVHAPAKNAPAQPSRARLLRYFLGAGLCCSLVSVAASALAEDNTRSGRAPVTVEAPPPPVVASAQGLRLDYSNAATASYAPATASYALGGALVTRGVTLFVLAPSPDEQENHALRVAARVASSGGCLQLEGVW